MFTTARFKRRALTVLTLIAFTVLFLGVQLQLTACAPASTDKAATGEGQAAPGADQPFTWQASSDCVACHATEGESLSDAAHIQAKAHGSLDCASCHTEETLLKQAHENVTFSSKVPKKAKLGTVSEQTCIACHADLPTMAQKTAGSTALTDSNGLSVNPHERPDGAKHAENPATCTDCHKGHSEDLSKDAMKYCAQCHHRGTFQCGTCHTVDD